MMTVQAWLDAAVGDAERRKLPELKPLLETLARSTEALRRAYATLAEPGDSPPAGKQP
jgi:hypothetical protein